MVTGNGARKTKLTIAHCKRTYRISLLRRDSRSDGDIFCQAGILQTRFHEDRFVDSRRQRSQEPLILGIRRRLLWWQRNGFTGDFFDPPTSRTGHHVRIDRVFRQRVFC